MATAPEPSASAADDEERRRSLQIESLHLVDFRQLSQSELYALSLTSSPAQHRCQDDAVIPKIDRSVFNESAGSRKQTFSRLRLVPRGKQPKPAPSPPASAAHIPLDEENSKIIEMLQRLFGVESLRTAARDGGGGGTSVGYNALVPFQGEFKSPDPNVFALQNIPICDVADDSAMKKRKRGRPRKNENSMAIVPVASPLPPPPPPKKKEEGEGFVDPVSEEVKKRTVGLENEAQVVEFLEGLKGEWSSQRKKKMTVEASELGSFLPAGWKVLLSVKKRAGRASILCRRYVSPYGQQFESFKEVSAHLLSFCGEDINIVKSSYPDDSPQYNINVPSGSVLCYGPAGDVKPDADASCLSLASTSVESHHKTQVSVPSSTEREKLNTLNENSSSSLAGGCKLGDSIGGAFDYQTANYQSMMDGTHNVNSVRGCSIEEDRVLNQKTVDIIEVSGAACNPIPLVLPTPVTINECGIIQHCDEMNSVTCIRNGVSDFSTKCHETAPWGNAQTLVDNNGDGVSERLVEDEQNVGSGSNRPFPNAEGKRFLGNNLEISDGKLAKDDKQHILCSDQSEVKDVSSNSQLQSSSDGFSLSPSQKDIKHFSINCSDRMQSFLLTESAIGDCFDGELLPIDKRISLPTGYTNNVSLSTCTEGASDCGGVDDAPNLSVANNVNDNHDPPTVELVTSFAEEKNPLNDQNHRIDYLLQTSSKCNLLTPPDDEQPSIFENLYNISAGTFDDAFMEPQLGLGSHNNDVAVDTYANESIMQGTLQGCESVALGSSVLNPFDKQSDNANKSCLSENAKSEQVDIHQTNSMECSGGNHKALLVYSQLPVKCDSLEKTGIMTSKLGLF
ncbi:hypothetical protein Ahy_A08g038437 isoform A [Arachis hypogaea]|uniref:MBD domain-containing protein n=1 Tax=Arachis hypogaea TaxID=3818 RepID=A0A445BTK4_ARAHY|nr:hypothetical protein Ahy_A08g038437 isoform A [Arachis hypogaea]